MKQFPSKIVGIVLIFLGILLFLGLISYTPRDLKWLSAPYNISCRNLVGVLGSYLGCVFFFTFGKAAYFFPFYSFFKGLSQFESIRFYGISQKKSISILSFFIFIFCLAAFIGIFYESAALVFEEAGLVGFFLSDFFRTYLGFWGAFISLFIIGAITSLLSFGYFFIDVFLGVKSGIKNALILLHKFIEEKRQKREAYKKKPRAKERAPQIKIYAPKHILPSEKKGPHIFSIEEKADKAVTEEKKPFRVFERRKDSLSQDVPKKKVEAFEHQNVKVFDAARFCLPSITVIKNPPLQDSVEAKGDIKEKIKDLESTLAEFGVMAKVVSVQKGPVVTMFEMEPQAGVKIQKITALADDIALALKSSNVRIVAPIPGKGTVGIEVPNKKKHFVFLREVIEEKNFMHNSSLLTLAIGKDVKGDPVIADLKEMPHLLIAGTTGSGKTVCVNSIIASILFKAKPDQVKFILVDPKMVELAPFGGIPHLITPIISEHKKVFAVLNWAVQEMERRYKILAGEGARNIEMYNRQEFRFPYVVIVIDELADLMAVARDNIELAIQRLAQLSRAVGIHLILATQRPSVDVITGVIKANFPARISFKVSSRVDSRTVLDRIGAEKLLGKGDLLFLNPSSVHFIRVQGSYIDDEDIEKLNSFLRNQGAPQYEEKITFEQEKVHSSLGEDELFNDAVRIILMTRQASASLLQRRLRVGYTRAARLLDLMEERGIVGAFCGSKAREILVDPDEYLAEKGLV